MITVSAIRFPRPLAAGFSLPIIVARKILAFFNFKTAITRDIEVKDNLTIARGDCGGNSRERGFQELL